MRNQQVADAVRAIRGSTGLSQWDFAHHFEIPIRALQNWEQGITLPDFSGLTRLLKIAGQQGHLLFEAMGLGQHEIMAMFPATSLVLDGTGKPAARTASAAQGKEMVATEIRLEGKRRVIGFDRELRIEPDRALTVTLKA